MMASIILNKSKKNSQEAYSTEPELMSKYISNRTVHMNIEKIRF